MRSSGVLAGAGGRLELACGGTRSFHAKTQKEATAPLNAAVETLRSGAPVPDQRLTLGHFLERWLAGLPGSNIKPSTVDYHQRYVRSHVLTSQVATKAPSRLQPADLSELYRTKLGEGLIKTTVHHLRAVTTEPSRRPNKRGRWSATSRTWSMLQAWRARSCTFWPAISPGS